MYEACRLWKRGKRDKKLIESDEDMQLVHYYLQKGFDPDKIAGLSASEKVFYRASMELAIEKEVEKYNAMFGHKK